MLASNVKAADFQDATTFLRAGGQKGPQRRILREGTYAINLAQFVVLTADQVFYLPLDRSEAATFAKMSAVIADRDGFRPKVISGTDDEVGIVTVHDGPAQPGEIIAGMSERRANAATYHNNSDADNSSPPAAIAGAAPGAVEDHYINRLFATIG